ncbi:GH12 family glycosyl hydrolase domain-containing protein [Virgisporangium aliadipatigenens]|nr:cellulose binding domain-containing protein [Virgisporangium aliadipatigenens]
MRKTLWSVAVVGLIAAGAAAAIANAPAAHADTVICDKYGSTTVGGRYVVMNNNWGNDAQQCINATANGFEITQINANKPTNGAPASYPAIYVGCHYTNCSPGTNLPRQISAIGSIPTSITYRYVSGATYNASFDIWMDPQPKTDGVNRTEIMIWFNRQGSIQPIGSATSTATIGGRSWQVWTGNNGGNDVVSYVAPSAIGSWSFDVLPFVNDTIARGYAQRSWYLTSLQAGFEPWIGGQGLAVTSFSTQVNTGTNSPTPGTSSPPPGGTGGCAASYRSISTWNGGYQGEVTVRNSGTANISGWNTVWTGGGTVNNLWNGRQTATSPVTVRNESYNGALAPGATTSYGFVANGTPPSAVSCTVA